MPASTLHPITDVAKPVMDRAAVRAHSGERAVMSTRAARMSNASANVSTIVTPLRTMFSPVMPADNPIYYSSVFRFGIADASIGICAVSHGEQHRPPGERFACVDGTSRSRGAGTVRRPDYGFVAPNRFPLGRPQHGMMPRLPLHRIEGS